MDHPSPLLQMQGLTKTYGDFTAVDQLDLEIREGEILALLGPNGAGKTTTIRMLMGILAATEGSVRLLGLDCFTERAEVMRHIGYLPDEPTFQDHLKGHELLTFSGTLRGMSGSETRAQALPIAERLGIAEALGDFAVNYSMGMKKKLSLVLAMMHDPKLLVLDEPTNGLDPIVTRTLLEIVRERAARGDAVFYSTHLIDQAERICDRVAILQHGRNLGLGTPTELRAQCGVDSLEGVFFALTGSEETEA